MNVSRNISPQPKCRIYNVDGSGRDTYIAFNSGGYIKPQAANYALSNIRLTTRNTSSGMARVPVTSKYNHYKSDGTGRDQYISYNSGGFVNTQTTFTTKLREYPPSDNRQKRSNSFDLSYTMRLPSIQDERKLQYMQEKSRQTREYFNRLAQPKSPSQSPDNTINACKCTTKNSLNSSQIFHNPATSTLENSPNKNLKQRQYTKTLPLKDLLSNSNGHQSMLQNGNQSMLQNGNQGVLSNGNQGMSGLKQQMLQVNKQNARIEDELLYPQKKTMKTLPSMNRSTMYDRRMMDSYLDNYPNQMLKTSEI